MQFEREKIAQFGLTSKTEYTFRDCPRCHTYGVLDNGDNCTNCGGHGTGGLFSKDGCIGSGEIIIETATGRQISHAEFSRHMTAKRTPDVSK